MYKIGAKAPPKKKEPSSDTDMSDAKAAAAKAIARALGCTGSNHAALEKALSAFYAACGGE